VPPGTLLFSQGGAGARINRPESASVDAWFRPDTGSGLMEQRYALPGSYVRVVPQPAQQRAQAALASRPWRQLSQMEADKLETPLSSLPRVPNRKLYLLRGIVLNELTGSFEVFENSGRVLVHHGSLGRRPVPMRRIVIVALLRMDPNEVYVSCSTSE